MKNVQAQLDIPHSQAQKLGQETARILIKGSYTSQSGRTIWIQECMSQAIAGTITYGPEQPIPIVASGAEVLSVTVKNATTLCSVSELIGEGFQPVALNMASATSPGGGFLNGARAQEEYLCRSSGLYACLLGNEMYTRSDFWRNPFYDDYVIYSPDVPVIRDDYGFLMDEPYYCSIISSPAVQANAVRSYMANREGEIEAFMWNRILKVLSVAHHHSHNALVLGAWGCGAFGNDGNMVAKLFRTALSENFRGAFRKVIFAITDWSLEKRFIGPFESIYCR